MREIQERVPVRFPVSSFRNIILKLLQLPSMGIMILIMIETDKSYRHLGINADLGIDPNSIPWTG